MPTARTEQRSAPITTQKLRLSCPMSVGICFNPVSLCLFPYISCSPLYCKPEKIITNDGGLKKKTPHTLDYCTVCVSCSSPPAVRDKSWERTGGRPGRGQSLCRDPTGTLRSRPRTKAERWMKKIIQEISVSLCETQHICCLSIWKQGDAFFPALFWTLIWIKWI